VRIGFYDNVDLSEFSRSAAETAVTKLKASFYPTGKMALSEMLLAAFFFMRSAAIVSKFPAYHKINLGFVA